jgi:hypothetical protein
MAAADVARVARTAPPRRTPKSTPSKSAAWLGSTTALAALLALATVVSRLPFRSRYLFSWDSANFALALDHYNVTFHQPQPPGYPLYVATAYLLRLLFGEANASYVALSILASGVAVFALTMAAQRLYGRTTALLAALLLATSSLFWSQGEVAYPYATLAAFTSLVAWLCLIVRDGGRAAPALTVAAALLIGLGGGFRSELLPFLLPLWLAAALQRAAPWPARLRTLALGAVVMAVTVLAWYVPMVQRSGGWAAYQQATAGYYTYFIQTTSGAGKLLLGLLENSRAVFGYLYNGLGLALLPMLYFIGRFFAPQRIVLDHRVRFLLLWLAPPLLFYVTVHVGNPGYVLSIVPALCVYAAEAVRGLVADVQHGLALLASRVRLPAALGAAGWVTPAAGLIVAGIALSNAALFLLANGEGRYREIRQIDRILSRQVAYIQEHAPPASSVLFAYDRSRQYRYYLPRHRLELLFDVAVAGAVTDTSRYWERRTSFTVPPGITMVVFPDLTRNTSDEPGRVQRIDLGEGVELFAARVEAGDEVRYGYQYATVSSQFAVPRSELAVGKEP